MHSYFLVDKLCVRFSKNLLRTGDAEESTCLARNNSLNLVKDCCSAKPCKLRM